MRTTKGPISQNPARTWFVVSIFTLGVILLAITGKAMPTPTPSANGKIAFLSTRDGPLEIYVMEANGANPTRLTHSPAGPPTLQMPALSPDGSKIVFTKASFDYNAYDIYLMDSDGSNEIRLTSSAGNDYQPDWSPDGTKIAFASRRDGDYEIYVINADGSNLVNLTNNPAEDNNPVWSPDGSKIAFDSNRSSVMFPEICVMNADGSDQVQLTKMTYSLAPTWSADGSKIAFMSAQFGSSIEIATVNADGSNLTRLTYSMPGDNATYPSWSPDGMKIAFCAGPNTEIYSIDVDGSNRIDLTNNPATDTMPNWQRRLIAPAPSPTPSPIPTSTPVATPTPTPGCTGDTWTSTGTTNAPARRSDHTVVWTGSEMIVWAGNADSFWNTGGRYNPSTDSWSETSTTNAPPPKQSYTAVWTGSEMLVWGASFNDNFPIGARYNPTTDSWTAMSTVNAPSGRCFHTAVWTGNEMIVWGGRYENGSGGRFYLNTGARYNPVTDTWTTTSMTNVPAGRNYHTAVWTGSEMIVWGGEANSSTFTTGGRYNPVNDSWIATGTNNTPSARAYHTAIWTGSEMIVWGGSHYEGNASYLLNTGGRYSPATDTWAAITPTNAPAAREDHTAVWTGSEMIVWGGGAIVSSFNTGGRYNPATDSWMATNTINSPHSRGSHTAVWTGAEMIIWGGINNSPPAFSSGGRYCVQSSTPDPTPLPMVNISGAISSCSNPVRGPVADVTLTLTGSSGGSTQSDGSGNYTFAVASGGSYTATPTKADRLPGSPGINTLDVVAVQKHFLGTALLAGCRLTAANVNSTPAVNTLDVIAIQRFFLGQTSGIGNVGKYQFTPVSRAYSTLANTQSSQNYDTLIYGDVASPFADRPGGPSQDTAR